MRRERTNKHQDLVFAVIAHKASSHTHPAQQLAIAAQLANFLRLSEQAPRLLAAFAFVANSQRLQDLLCAWTVG